jgi:hypothetical protein
MTSHRTVVAVAVGVTFCMLVYMLPATVAKAFEMDEGAVNAYAERVLDGAVPHRDFLTFYGPANPWVVAGAFALFGESVGVERAVGMLYRILILLALFALGRRLGGLAGGVLAAAITGTLMAEEVIWAYASYGAMAFGLVGLAVLVRSATATPSRRADVLLVAAGVASGCALLMRFDFAPAVVLSSLPILALASRYVRARYASGFLATLVVLAVHLAIVGPERIARLVGDLRASGPARYLQRQTVWEFPGNLLLAANCLTALFIVTGAILIWRYRAQFEPRVVLAIGLFNIAFLPLTIARMDPLHIRPYAVVPLSLAPALALFIVSKVGRAIPRLGTAISVLVVAAVALAVFYYGRYDYDYLRSVRGVPSGYRGFYDDDSFGARVVVERARRVTRPGESLFVGPEDLRRTNYGPTYMYFLLRDLEPASYYMEMNPKTANRRGSGLATELRRADWLILTSEWDNWDEANASSEYGSPAPNKVVDELFCVRLESGQYRLYERCDRTQ